MRHLYSQLNRVYGQPGRAYSGTYPIAPWMGGDAGPASGRRGPGALPQFFEEWDERRGDASFPNGPYSNVSPGYGYDGDYPAGRRGSDYPFGPAPAFRSPPGFGRGDTDTGYRPDAAGFTPERGYPRQGGTTDYVGAPVSAGRRYELREFDGEYVCICELPGFERSDIECTYEDGVFYIDAYRDGSQDSDNVWMRRPRRMRERVPLPRQVAVDDITASYRKGILEVRMPLVGRGGRDGQSITIHD
ncbi:Hsp20/alpha crystallin family protein [Haloarchaeobius sp. DT45]|uniref:Hsp20/alpha crystallin family protein n=1 Tax=Haloarchaeobius sp. DT45 TaxID=3446116 RepID=UPI003F6C30FC